MLEGAVQQQNFGRSLLGLDGKPPSGTWGGGQSRGLVGEAVMAEERGERTPGGRRGGTSGGEGCEKKLLCQTLKHQVSAPPGRISETGHQGLQLMATRGTPEGLGVQACL